MIFPNMLILTSLGAAVASGSSATPTCDQTMNDRTLIAPRRRYYPARVQHPIYRFHD
jgi:hypothetical protein